MGELIDLTKPENIVSGKIIDKAIYIHKKLGAGLLESVYEETLAFFLEREGLKVEKQKSVAVEIDGLRIPVGFRADLIINDSVLCEIKSVEKMMPVHTAQIMTYLKLTGLKTGLLINFNVPLLKDGIKRFVI